jgi:putative SOS response-associated peptidase YedK
MCNLYKMSNSAAEVARTFNAIPRTPVGNHGEQVYPGTPGLVVADGEVRQMSWGFPLALTGKKGQALKPRPVNNARTDKLRGPFWRDSFIHRRCLIPVSAYAEAQGPKGGKTRTWISVPAKDSQSELFAVAALWRDSDEWGPCYSMITTEASAAVEAVHHRMPMILPRDLWVDWVRADPKEAFAQCQPWQGELAIERTDEGWVG